MKNQGSKVKTKYLNNYLKSSYVAVCVATALSGMSFGAAAEEQDGANQAIETIEVRGIRRSLTEALNTKRFANSVVDSISAEDIGKFPDKNIGDAMQRIPGVTVVRTFGEVSGVTVRGTAPEHSMVLLNGQNVASVGWFDLGGVNRSFNFEMLASEQISGMDVYKSVESDINEGAMGGTVNLKTRKPLDMDSGTVFASVENAYHGNAKEWSPAYSGLASWKNEQENFGILVAYSNEESKVYRETLSTFGPPGATELEDSNGVLRKTSCCAASILFDEDRERSSSQISVQYAPSDALTLGLDYNLFELENDHINSALFTIMGYGTLQGDSVRVNEQGIVTAATVTASGPGRAPLFNNTVLRTPDMQTDVINFTANYQAEAWSADFVIGQSTAEGRIGQTSTWWGDISERANSGFSYDVSGPLELIPVNPDYMSSHDNFELFHEYTYINYERDNEIDYIQADFTFELDSPVMTSIQAGIKFQEQVFSYQENNQDLNVDAIREGGERLTLGDFNGGFVSGLHSAEGRAGSLSGFPIGTRGLWDYARNNAPGTITVKDAFSIEEDIAAAYVKANFSGEGFRGNLGLRVVETDILSKGEINGVKGEVDKSYTNYLPSLNLAIDLSEDMIFRFAAGSTVSRPDYDDMKVADIISESFKTANVGSPDLDPYKSDQYDMGVEWYFNPSSVLGATLFVKNISDYIEQTTAAEFYPGCGEGCLVTRSRNVGTADVRGIELQYQHAFENGFGIQANYTYTDSSRTDSTGKEMPIEEVSQNSYNLSGYYENDLFSVRLAYNYRDDWVRQYNGSSLDSLNDAYDQVDASVVWHVTDNIDVSFEAINLLNEALVLRQPTAGNIVHAVDEFGTRYFVGASVRF
ncbi:MULTISPECIES: TonB-dependent receptor [Pseudoalteromonas]|uniref:TonB-dependent receptor n=1 Tax=Pseudoalteromonas TaxID=53246 RepID=UPI000F791861|nr:MULTISPECIES: TonB-dependent receptor [Pseudoalteromonas]MCG7562006.1 TonB-dependent receptor [Pseudoalteromonas sp. McH1-42]